LLIKLGVHSQKPTLDTLPYDIIAHIYSYAWSVCLSFTCKRLYAFFKTQFPDRIWLDARICSEPRCSELWSLCPNWPYTELSSICFYTCVLNHDYDRSRLADLLIDWAGPRYRLRRRPSMIDIHVFDMLILLNKSVYGD